MTIDMFESEGYHSGQTDFFEHNVILLRGYASSYADAILTSLNSITVAAPFRQMQTRRGYFMSAEISNCGQLGWLSDKTGYRYTNVDPLTGNSWPEMPDLMRQLARSAAKKAGYNDFEPDSCIINRYAAGTKMSLHQDIDEQDFSAPIVSVSFGIPATFLFGGMRRQDKVIKIPLFHGDVIVWGGQDRLRFHGIAPIKPASHAKVGDIRINLTFRKAG